MLVQFTQENGSGVLTWKKYVPYAIINIAPDAACVDTAAIANNVRRRSTGSFQISRKFALDLTAFSASMAAWISATSPGTLSGWGRIQSSAFSACAGLSTRMSQRGDSGMKNMPMDMKKGTMKIMPSGMMYELRPCMSCVALSMTVPMSVPIEVHIWKTEIMRPR